MTDERLPEHFVVLSKVAPELMIDLKYTTHDNLIGRPLAGYSKEGVAVITEIAANSLRAMAQKLQQASIKNQLKMSAPTLIIWDTYRPDRACEDFWHWSQSECQKTKNEYYPNIDKRDFFKLGYIARKSSHSRGSTADLNIIDTATGKMLDMGTRFDFMDPLSHPDNLDVSKEVYANRQFLKKLLSDFGWLGIEQEWWHFTYTDEPYPQTYFNFDVKKY
ncbi:MAG: M15 family metallopeptidase [Proteobacteria bacterium]|nr:M15 family metallopeptidase [Pseudomonadota bacterium]